MLTMRPVRLWKNFPRELVNASLKKYLGQHALRGIAGNNPSVRKSGTRELHRPHSLHYCCYCQQHIILKIFPTMFLRQETFISFLTNSRWREILLEGNYSFYGKIEASRESPCIWNGSSSVVPTFPVPRKVSMQMIGVLSLKCKGSWDNLGFGSCM